MKFYIHRLRRPEKGENDLTLWVRDPEPVASNKQCQPGVHFVLNERALKKERYAHIHAFASLGRCLDRAIGEV